MVEIECRYGEAVIRDGHRTANVLKLNYGHAGKLFIDRLCEDGEMDRVRDLYEKNYAACIQSDTTEKQAMAAALIITADQLATEWIFHDDRALVAPELGEFLKEKTLDFKCPNRALGDSPASSHALFQMVRLIIAISCSMIP